MHRAARHTLTHTKFMMPPPPLTREQIDAKRAAALKRQQAENAELLARQDAIHALAYELHQKAHNDETVQEKPGYDVSLQEATKLVDAAIAMLKEAEAKAAADAKAAAEAKAAADAKAAEEAKAEGGAAGHAAPAIESPEQPPGADQQ